MFQGTKQDSDISTVGGSAVARTRRYLGIRALRDLPSTAKPYQNLSFGMDYKDMKENLDITNSTISSPIRYFPICVNYGAAWVADKSFTEFNSSLNFHLRGLGSGQNDYSNKRYGADGNFIYLSHRHLPHPGYQRWRAGVWQDPGSSGQRATGQRRAICRRWHGHRSRLSRGHSSGRQRFFRHG